MRFRAAATVVPIPTPLASRNRPRMIRIVSRRAFWGGVLLRRNVKQYQAPYGPPQLLVALTLSPGTTAWA